MATANCTLSYVRTMDKGTNEGSATYHFGYGKAGQRWVTCYKVTVPSYTGTPSSITFSLNVNRGTAYPTDKDSTWKIGLDEEAPVWSAADGAYTAGSAYAAGWYGKEGSWLGTFSGAISSSNVSKTVTISTKSAILDGGNTFYVYLFSGADAYNSIKLSSISAYVTYTNETTTATNLYVGTASTPASTTAYPTPNKRTVYYRVAGLANQLKNYKYFKVYLSSGFSMTAITDSTYGTVGYTPSGTCIDTYEPSSSSTAYEFTRSFSIPNTNFKIGANTGIVVVASTTTYPSRYWRIGERSGSTYLPVIRYIYPQATDWFQSIISVNAKVTGKNSVTFNVVHNTSNYPRYLNYVCIGKTSASTSGQSSEPNYYCYSTTGEISSSGASYSSSNSTFSAGTSYTCYPHADANTSYASSGYYGLGSVSFTTDADYSGTNTSSVTSTTTATITSTVNSTTNLDGYIYYSTSSGLTSRPSTKQAYSSRKITVNLTGLTANKTHTYYFYVYSSVSGILYSIGSTSFTTDANSYIQTSTLSSVALFDAIVNVSTPSSITNLDGKTYFSVDNSSLTESLTINASGLYNTNITISNLSQNTEYKYYTYVKSSVTGYFYQTGSVTFTTASANYSADCVVSGITHNSAYLCAVNYSSTVGINDYCYITTEDYGQEINSTEYEPIIWEEIKHDRYESLHVGNLVAGMPYTYYFYIYSNVLNKYMKLGSVSFVTYSTVMYYGNDLKSYRGYMLNPNTGMLEGICLYSENTNERMI